MNATYAFARLLWRPATFWSLLVLLGFGLSLVWVHHLLSSSLPYFADSSQPRALRS